MQSLLSLLVGKLVCIEFSLSRAGAQVVSSVEWPLPSGNGLAGQLTRVACCVYLHPY